MGAPRVRPAGSDLLVHLRRARDHIDRHYAAPIDLDRLAAVAGVAKYHFARCFEAAYGETPIRHLTRHRIERAQDLPAPARQPHGHRDLHRRGVRQPRFVLHALPGTGGTAGSA